MNYYLDVAGLQALIKKIVANDKSVASTAQSQLDAVTGSTKGAYVANTSANYIKEVTNLQAADNALDAQLKALDTAIGNATHKPVSPATGSVITVDDGTDTVKAQKIDVNVGAGLIKDNGVLKANVDGNTILLDNNQLKSGLKLKYIPAVAAHDNDPRVPAMIALAYGDTPTPIEGTAISVDNIVGNGLISTSAYDSATGKLTLTFINGQVHEVDLAAMLDLDDVIIATGSTDYLEAAQNGGENDGQIKLGVKKGDAVYDDNNHTLTASTAGLMTNASVASIKSYVDYNDGVLDGKITTLNNSLAAVAKTGAAADVSIADKGGKITATNVEDALQELATSIETINGKPMSKVVSGDVITAAAPDAETGNQTLSVNVDDTTIEKSAGATPALQAKTSAITVSGITATATTTASLATAGTIASAISSAAANAADSVAVTAAGDGVYIAAARDSSDTKKINVTGTYGVFNTPTTTDNALAASTNGIAKAEDVATAVNDVVANLDGSATAGATGSSVPTADFYVLSKVSEVNGVVQAVGTGADDSKAVTLKKLAATGAAADVSYDNTTAAMTGSPATVQAAIDAIDGRVDTLESSVANIGTINPAFVNSYFEWEVAGEPAGNEPKHTPAP